MKVHNEGSNVLVTFTRPVDDLPQRFVLTSGTTYLGKYVVEFINLLCRTTNKNLSVELENKEVESFVCVRGNNIEKCECVRSGKIKISKSETGTTPVRHSYTYKSADSKSEHESIYSKSSTDNDTQNVDQNVDTDSDSIEIQNNDGETSTINTTHKRKRSRKYEDKV